jgi:hypothetical protein
VLSVGPDQFVTTIITWQHRNCRFRKIDNQFCIGGWATLTRIDAKV